MLTGRSYSAHEAREMRLVHEVVEDAFSRSMALGGSLAAHCMSAMRLTKRLVISSRRQVLRMFLDEVTKARTEIAKSSRHVATISGGAPNGRNRPR